MKDNKRIPYLKILPIILISLAAYKIIDNTDAVLKVLKSFFSLITPFLWAFGFAYFLNPQVKYLERKFKLKRILSLFIVYVVLLGVLSFAIGIVTPRLLDNVKQIVVDIPSYINATENFINSASENLNILGNDEVAGYIRSNAIQFIEKFGKLLEAGLNVALFKIISFTSGFFKVIVGLLISTYMLMDKEKIIDSIKKFIYAFLGYKKGNQLIEFGVEVDRIFSKYIIGKVIDSAIIGVLCLILLAAIKSPFTVLISIIVGITNMIPYFGPFIGMIVGGIIVLFASPIKAIWVVIVIFILQQFDGWYLGPKILGDKVGLSPLWIIFAVIVGGGFFGVMGMLFGVPFIAALRILVDEIIDKKLETKSKEIE
ncbi:AI-2E family transporter [Clostridium polynesiense]|uniref:AI-2E family transporter n=1 Tax=Clostridium polynesiense TaxID=1325933 RepID=UPI00058EC9FC|nr:AI-2E family transporter [Clostridium polynesiense]